MAIYKKDSLGDYISSLRMSDSGMKKDELEGKLPSIEAKTEAADEIEPPPSEESGLTDKEAMDYTKGGVAVVKGIFDAMQKQKEFEAKLQTEAAKGQAKSAMEGSQRKLVGSTAPLRQLIAAYRPR